MQIVINIAVVFVLALFAIVGVVNISKAETWSCSYLHTGEAKIMVTERKGNSFIQSYKVGYEEFLIDESDVVLELYLWSNYDVDKDINMSSI